MKKMFSVLIVLVMFTLVLPVNIYAQQTSRKIETISSKFSVKADSAYDAYFAGSISSGLIAVQKDGKYGYLDSDQNVVIPIKYKSAKGFAGDYALVQGQDDKFYIIDKSGKEKPVKYQGKQLDSKSYLQPAGLYENGLISLNPEEVWPPTCYVDMAGKTVLPLDGSYDRQGFSNGYLLSDKGLYDNKAKLLTTWKDGIEINLGQDIQHAFVSDGLIPFSKKDKDDKYKYGYINLKGDIVIEPIYDAAFSFSGGYAVVQQGDNDFAIDTKNRRVTPKQPLNTLQFGFFGGRFVTNNQLMDETGKVVYTCPDGVTLSVNNSAYGSRYDEFDPVFIIRNEDDKFGAIDKNGNELLRCEYDYIHTFKNGYSTGVKGNKLIVFKLGDEGIDFTSSKIGFSITLPISWQGKYIVREYEDYATFIYKDSEKVGDIGNLFSIQRFNGKLTPEEAKQGAGYRYLLASNDKYSYVLSNPSGVEYTEKTEAEYNKLSADIEAIGKTIKIIPIKK